ncbi:pectate lyase [Diaporthe amygdali]|uniref:pectate lyase n=1 Tax=Phomopsis amygdali TaxID=1214568 RepID=UPI0022FF446E|nr:pectate lyase [Diaporthe amygdali]KAJ0124331.1 pectate lyase [Diaporthe amygdali]
MPSPIILLASLPAALAATIYVSPTGSSSGTGTLTSPYASIQSAVDKAVAGDIISLRGGTYKPTKNISIKKSGTPGAYYTLTAYGDESVIIDGEALTGTPAEVGGSLDRPDRGVLHFEGTSYWNVSKITLINGPYGVYLQDGNNNIFDRIVTHDNYETGFQMQGSISNNQILYLDSYMNRDPRKNGESADGFACKEGSGTGNVLKGARLWNNVDDGLDLWEFASPVTIQDTISWGNGFNRWDFSPFEGDGNGFKLGGGSTTKANHVVTNSIAFSNFAKGFTDNKQPGAFTFTRNTAYKNGGVGFQLTGATDVTGTFTKNVAALNSGGSTTQADQISLKSATSSGNSWDSSTKWTDASFKSVDVTLVQGKRGSNGKVPASNFLLPASGAAIGATIA